MEYNYFNKDAYDEYGIFVNINNYLQTLLSFEYSPLSKISLDLVLISEVYDYFSTRDAALEMIYQLIKRANTLISTVYFEPKLYGGLLDLAVAINMISKKTGTFTKPRNTLFRTLEPMLLNICRDKKKALTSLKASDYDLINGVSGIGVYLLSLGCEFSPELRDLISQYFDLLSSMNNGKYNWFIEYENQVSTNEEMERYKDGHYDCGVAHGIAGPLCILSELNQNKINNSAIERIVSFYETIEYNENGVSLWPGKKAPKEDFFLKYTNLSWCYGYTGISNSLLKAYTSLQNTSAYNRILGNSVSLWNSIKIDNDMKYLRTLTICHGYAGVLCGMVQTYRATGDVSLLVNIFKLRRYIMERIDSVKNYSSILEGKQGILLSLLSTINDKTSFEKILLLA